MRRGKIVFGDVGSDIIWVIAVVVIFCKGSNRYSNLLFFVIVLESTKSTFHRMY